MQACAVQEEEEEKEESRRGEGRKESTRVCGEVRITVASPRARPSTRVLIQDVTQFGDLLCF